MRARSAVLAAVVGAVALGTVLYAAVQQQLLPGWMPADWASASPQQDRIRVAYSANIGHAIPIVGIREGVFADRLPDLHIETRIFDSGPPVIESLFAGHVDIAYVGPGPAITGHINSEDGDLKILAGAASGGASFVAHPDAVGTVAGIDSDSDFDFDGARIAAPQIGNTQDVSLRHRLSELGLATAERGGSVVVYNVPNPDIYTLFAKGDVDGAWVAEPWATILVHDLDGVRLFHEEDVWPDGRFASVLLVAGAGYVAQNPGTVGRWLDAHEAVADRINADRDGAASTFNAFLAGYLGRGLDPAVVEDSLSAIEITTDPVRGSVLTFAERAAGLGYLGRGGQDRDLSGLFHDYDFDGAAAAAMPPGGPGAAPGGDDDGGGA